MAPMNIDMKIFNVVPPNKIQQNIQRTVSSGYFISDTRIIK